MAHERIVQKIIENGGVHADSIYHIGFHSVVYLLSFFLNYSIPEIIVLFGQLLSIISGLTFDLLAKWIINNSYCVKFASVLLLFWSQFPNYLINWSRYPYLLGLTILPLAWIVCVDWLDQKKSIIL